MIYLFILLSILCSASAQIALKIGMNRFGEFSIDPLWAFLWKCATNPYLVMGITLHVLALFTWLYVINKVEVSFAYPFISLGFVFVLLIGYLFLGESIDGAKAAGISLIIAGIFVLSQSRAL